MAVSSVIPNCVQVRLLYLNNGALAINVLNAVVTGSVTVNQALANSLGSAIKSAFTTNVGTHYNTSFVLVRVGVRDMRGENLPEFLDTNAVAAGTGIADALPLSTAMALTLRTAKSGKSFRGRIYLPGMTEAENTPGGGIDAAASAAGVAFVAGVQAAMTGQGLQLGVASRAAELTTIVKNVFHNDGTSSTTTLSTTQAKPAQITPVVSVESRTASWETQRRRGNGRGVPPSMLSNPTFRQLSEG
jgi:hypothetical protein